MFTAGLIVDSRMTSLSGMPSTSIFDMVVAMSIIPPFMLPVCRSVEIESG